MKKLLTSVMALLVTVFLFGGCRSSAQPIDSIGGNEISSSGETFAPESSSSEKEEITTAGSVESSLSEMDTPKEMTMEEIEAELGFGYRLPDESLYDGEIFCTLTPNRDAIALSFHANEFAGRVVVWKSMQEETDQYDKWSQWPEAGMETINGIDIRFRGNTSDEKGIAFWKQSGFQYVLNCETAPGANIMSILPLFIENE